jgi:GNAT superfamily N-acetyltransferase
MNYIFRKAAQADKAPIWKILQQAILRRKNDGSNQWQDGYPNEDVVQRDIERGIGYVLTNNDAVIGYAAIILSDEPAYEKIVGTWLTKGDFYVVHRIAISDDFIGQGLGRKILEFIEELAKKNHVPSIKVDTNFDNAAMLRTFEKLGYTYCGEVTFRDSPRKAFEKVILK